MKTLQVDKSRFDIAKWGAVIILFLAGVIANYYFSAMPLSQRLIGWLLLGAMVLFIGFQTSQGVRVHHFAKQSYIELQKVVWPTRQETVQTALIVAAMVAVVGLLLWGIDGVLLWAVSILTGQRG